MLRALIIASDWRDNLSVIHACIFTAVNRPKMKIVSINGIGFVLYKLIGGQSLRSQKQVYSCGGWF